MKKTFTLSAMALSVAFAGCSSSDGGGSSAQPAYSFESQFEAGESSISYSGQTARQVLISDLKSLIAGDFATATVASDVLDELNALYDANSGGDIDNTNYLLTKGAETLSPGPTYGDISTGKDLKEKIAGEDNSLRHTTLRGWATGLDANPTPDEFVQYLFGIVAANAVDPSVRLNPVDAGDALPPYLTVTGVDLQQLTNKFLLMSVAYSQGTGDYLSDDLGNGKGINASAEQTVNNGVPKPYSGLEHAWDEAFGYFGAARDYDLYTDAEIRNHSSAEGNPRGEGYFDTNGDGEIDLRSEINFAAAVNAAKRDFGSSDDAKTNFTAAIFDAFVRGRSLITESGADVDLVELEAQRDIIVNNWEKVYAATAVHYINDTLQDMNDFGTNDYSFRNHAKHWSELKGFVMGLQFNPNALISITDIETINTNLGDAPVLSTADTTTINNYRASLIASRDILQAAYNFADENMGDANGENGW
ncbi:MAG: DUF4856 domain-containing protein [Oleiphilaceae bacterium]|nr:DUF4856 domain-containing protein [Oleiphilaceae bacterium]